MREYILFFDEIDKTKITDVGGKGANLGELTKAGFSVPKGFCINTKSYKHLILSNDEMEVFFKKLDNANYENLNDIKSIGEDIRKFIMSLPIPIKIENEIIKAWESLGKDKYYSIRSSATAEDLPTASFAGQQDTFLNIIGKDQILLNIRKCWASLFTDRAIIYRNKNGFDHRNVFLSVVIQEMVFSEISGIMFTADPINGNRNTICIDASLGLGEALVSGIVSADLYKVYNSKIIEKKIAEKALAIYPIKSGGTKTVSIDKQKQNLQVLTDKQIIELAKVAKKIENYYKKPQDIEWCIYEEKVYIVQSRPITSLYPAPKSYTGNINVFYSFGHQQMMTDAMSDFSISMWKTLFCFGKYDENSKESVLFQNVGNRIYVNSYKLINSKIKYKFVKALKHIDEKMSVAFSEIVEDEKFKEKSDFKLSKNMLKNIIFLFKTVIIDLKTDVTNDTIENSNKITNDFLEEKKKYITEVDGVERLERIENVLETIFEYMIKNVAIHLLSGKIALNKVKKYLTNWFGDDLGIDELEKSPKGNVTTEMGLKIGDLADVVRKDDSIKQYLKIAKNETFYENLKKIDSTGVFTIEFEKFMDIYGMRCPGEIDIQNERWKQQPVKIISSVLSNVESFKQGEHRDKFKKGEEKVNDTINNIIEKVKETKGKRKAEKIEHLIKVYRNTMGIRETPKYTIIRFFEIVKEIILNEGLVLKNENKIQCVTDIYYLSLSEIICIKNNEFESNYGHRDIKSLINKRRQNFEIYKKLVPPRIITTEGEIIDGKLKNDNAPEGSLIGSPVSSGIVEGYAKVIMTPDEGVLNKGEILIAPFTDPGWTPLFSAASGLVMEVGGLMTHGAVVAREYGIPAVVGVDEAMKKIKTGDYIRINGTVGYVEIIEK